MKFKNPGRVFHLLSLAAVAGFAAALILCSAGMKTAVGAVLDNGYLGQGLLRLAAFHLRESALNLFLYTWGIGFGVLLLFAVFAKVLLGKGIPGSTPPRAGTAGKGLRCAAALCLLLPTLLCLWVLCLGRPVSGNRPHVILISLDTLRADHMGSYGYERDTTPNLDAFARENILFERCYVQEPWTLSSHVSMLTSLYPHVHGVSEEQALSPKVTTLAETLKNDGYYTMGIVRKCGWMKPWYGFYQGFDQYVEDDYSPSAPKRNAQFQTRFIVNQVGKQKDKGLFLFLHYYDIHSDWEQLPYDAPKNFRTRFYPDNSGGFDGSGYGRNASRFLLHVNRHKIELDPDLLNCLTALYDGSVAYTDHWMGQLFKELKDLGIYDNALIIVTSDHGEEFQEHGSLLHSNPYYYEEIMRVPLIVKLPAGSIGTISRNASEGSSGGSSHGSSGGLDRGASAGRRISALVESIDIMPSILDFLGIESKAELQGRSFMPLIDGAGAREAEHVYGLTGPGNVMVRSKRWKMMSDDISMKENYRLYDLVTDPKEKQDMLKENPDVYDALMKRISGRYNEMRSRYTGGRVEMTDEQIERLKKLGYLQ